MRFNRRGKQQRPHMMAKETQKAGVSLAEAAEKINDVHLADALCRIEKMEISWEIKILEFADYLGSEFSGVALAAQFPWLEMYTLSHVIHLPLSYLPVAVYDRSAKWIDKFPVLSLAGYIRFAVFCINDRMTLRNRIARSHEAMYVLLAMVLRRRPVALMHILPNLWEVSQDKVPVTVWMMAQASQGDLCVGFFCWVRTLLPVLVGNKDPRSTDLILQLVENILSTSDALPRLVSAAAAWKGEALLLPPPSFEIFLRLTFPASSATEQPTHRFEAIYPLFKKVALACAPPGEETKLVAQQIFTLSLELAGEGNPVLAKEATEIALWSVTGNIHCCNHWDNLYNEHLQASVSLLKKLVYESEHDALKLSSSASHALALNQTIKSFMILNKQSITKRVSNTSLYIEADNSCKVILKRLSPRSGFSNAFIIIAIAAVFVFASVLLSSRPWITTKLLQRFEEQRTKRNKSKEKNLRR